MLILIFSHNSQDVIELYYIATCSICEVECGKHYII